jgi:hypothetical protein
MRTITKVALVSLVLEIAGLIFISAGKPDYDGGDLGALIFWLAYFHVFLIVAVMLFAIVIVQGIMRGTRLQRGKQHENRPHRSRR